MAELEPKFKIYSPTSHLDHIVGRSSGLDERFWGWWMYYHPGNNTKILQQALEDAARRVSVRLNIDSFTHMMTGGVPNYMDKLPVRFPDYDSRELQRFNNRRAERRLIDAGAQWIDVNPPRGLKQHLLPPLGRDHRKLVVQDSEGWLLDINVSDLDFSRPGAEVLIRDAQAVEILAAQFDRINENRLVTDYSEPLTSDTELVLDAGYPGRSEILTRGIDLIENSQSTILMGTPFLPDGKLVQALAKAYERGVVIEFITANQSKVDDIFLKMVGIRSNLMLKIGKMRIPILYHPDWMHAKFLIVDGEVVAVTSHNWTESGVRAGTAEDGLFSTNQGLIAEMTDFHNKLKGDITLANS